MSHASPESIIPKQLASLKRWSLWRVQSRSWRDGGGSPLTKPVSVMPLVALVGEYPVVIFLLGDDNPPGTMALVGVNL